MLNAELNKLMKFDYDYSDQYNKAQQIVHLCKDSIKTHYI